MQLRNVLVNGEGRHVCSLVCFLEHIFSLCGVSGRLLLLIIPQVQQHCHNTHILLSSLPEKEEQW